MNKGKPESEQKVEISFEVIDLTFKNIQKQQALESLKSDKYKKEKFKKSNDAVLVKDFGIKKAVFKECLSHMKIAVEEDHSAPGKWKSVMYYHDVFANEARVLMDNLELFSLRSANSVLNLAHDAATESKVASPEF